MTIQHPTKVQPRVATQAGFYDFYGVQFTPMIRLARGLVDTSERAEEIVQDAFVRAFERWDRVDEPLAYVRTAVINGARSELRKREARRRFGRQQPLASAATEGDYLVDALDKLAPKRKTALVLRFYAQMSEREIAEAIDVRPGLDRVGVSRRTLCRWRADGTFPQALRLGANSIGWPRHVIDEWLAPPPPPPHDLPLHDLPRAPRPMQRPSHPRTEPHRVLRRLWWVLS